MLVFENTVKQFIVYVSDQIVDVLTNQVNKILDELHDVRRCRELIVTKLL